MNSYFSNQFKKIKNTEQLKDFSNKLVEYRQYIGSNEGQVLYSEFFQNMQDKIKEKEKNESENISEEVRVLYVLLPELGVLTSVSDCILIFCGRPSYCPTTLP